jgi:2-keto-4-pentenoate hydratase/2-oxohepta-3-ene-1,7-dioic acid hydratase in catechol pathway
VLFSKEQTVYHQLPWERAKSFDGSAVFSEFIDLNEDLNIEDLGIRLSINHIVKQSGNVTQMLFKPKELLRFIQTDISFEDGDILMTGTPEGVGAIASGDFFQAEVLHRGTVILNCQWTAR